MFFYTEPTLARRTPWAVTGAVSPPSKLLETGTRRGEREDGWERKGAMRWGRKRMERKEREDGRRVEAETDRQSSSIWNGTKRKELTNEWNQTKGGEVLDWGMRGKARPPLLLPLLRSPPWECRACVFSSSSDLPRFHSHTKTGRRRTWHRGTWRSWQRCVCVSVREKQIKRHWLTCLADKGGCERMACLSEMSHLTPAHTLNPLNTNTGSLPSFFLTVSVFASASHCLSLDI